nr:MAG: capsid protein [Cressdnaviricota sp.]
MTRIAVSFTKQGLTETNVIYAKNVSPIYTMNPKFKKPRAKRVGKKVAKLSAPMKKAIRNELSVASENKQVSYQNPFSAGLLTSLINGAVNAPLNDVSSWVRLVPPINQGTGLNNRIGNRIRPLSCVLNLTVSTLGTNPSVDLVARIFMVSDKSVKSYNIENPAVGTTTINYQKMLDRGGSPSQYIGGAVDNLIPINGNQFTKHHDILVHLVKSQGIETGGSVPASGDNTGATPHTLYHAKLKVPLPKVLKYDQNLDVFPSNCAPYLCIGYAYVNGNAMVSNQIGFQALSVMVFEDA